MTDLERVRDYCDNPWEVFTDEEGCRGFRQKDRTGLVEAIDAHLKEDARLRKQVDQLAMMRGKQITALWAENDRLREELEKAEFAGKAARISTALEDENARLLYLALDHVAENARLREALEKIVTWEGTHPADIARNALKETNDG